MRTAQSSSAGVPCKLLFVGAFGSLVELAVRIPRHELLKNVSYVCLYVFFCLSMYVCVYVCMCTHMITYVYIDM